MAKRKRNVGRYLKPVHAGDNPQYEQDLKIYKKQRAVRWFFYALTLVLGSLTSVVTITMVYWDRGRAGLFSFILGAALSLGFVALALRAEAKAESRFLEHAKARL